jgi:hypothetical protein
MINPLNDKFPFMISGDINRKVMIDDLSLGLLMIYPFIIET